MGSRIEYYRPRGVAGQYKVTITLEFLQTETAHIFVRKEYEMLNEWKWKLIEPKEKEGNIWRYEEFPFVYRDAIQINLQDSEVAWPQALCYFALWESIDRSNCPDLFGDTFFVEFHPIELIDLDKENDRHPLRPRHHHE